MFIILWTSLFLLFLLGFVVLGVFSIYNFLIKKDYGMAAIFGIFAFICFLVLMDDYFKDSPITFGVSDIDLMYLWL